MDEVIFKIAGREEWAAAETTRVYTGAPIDVQDGFIHLSTAAQVAETAARHFQGRADLFLVSVSAEALGAALRYEPSRGDDLFPHLYGELPLSAVRSVRPLPLGADGQHVFPSLP